MPARFTNLFRNPGVLRGASLLVILLIIAFLFSVYSRSTTETAQRQYLSAAVSESGKILIGTDYGLIFGEFVEGQLKEEAAQTNWATKALSLVRANPFSQAITLVSASPHPSDLVFAAGESDFFRSSDDATSWEKVSGISGVRMLSYSPRDAKVVIALTADALWISKDGGVNWQGMKSAVQLPYPRTSVTFSAHDPNVIYLATGGDGVFKSPDQGLTWISMNQGWPDYSFGSDPYIPVSDILSDPAERRLYAVLGHRLFELEDEGRSWRELGQPIYDELSSGVTIEGSHFLISYIGDVKVISFAINQGPGHIHALDPEKGFIRSYFGGVRAVLYQSRDGGRTWNRVLQLQAPIRSLLFDAQSSSLVVVSETEISTLKVSK